MQRLFILFVLSVLSYVGGTSTWTSMEVVRKPCTSFVSSTVSCSPVNIARIEHSGTSKTVLPVPVDPMCSSGQNIFFVLNLEFNTEYSSQPSAQQVTFSFFDASGIVAQAIIKPSQVTIGTSVQDIDTDVFAAGFAYVSCTIDPTKMRLSIEDATGMVYFSSTAQLNVDITKLTRLDYTFESSGAGVVYEVAYTENGCYDFTPPPMPETNIGIFGTITFEDAGSLLSSLSRVKSCVNGSTTLATQRKGDTSHVYVAATYMDSASALNAVQTITTPSLLASCTELPRAVGRYTLCNVPTCPFQNYTMYALVATKSAPTGWETGRAAMCALSYLQDLNSPHVTSVSTPAIDAKIAKSVSDTLKTYGDKRQWFQVSFCVAYAPQQLFESKNNTQSINLMCNSGAAGVVAVALVYKNEASFFLGNNDGACLDYKEDALDYAYFSSPAKGQKNNIFTELYFILPVSIGGGLALVGVAVCVYYVSRSTPRKRQKKRKSRVLRKSDYVSLGDSSSGSDS